MANDFAAIQQTAFEAFHENIANSDTSWMSAVEVVAGAENTLSVGAQLSGGIYGAAAATGAVAVSDISTYKSDISSSYFEREVQIRWQDMTQDPGRVTRAAVSMAAAATASVRDLVEVGLLSCFTTLHPNPALVDTAAAGKFYCDTALQIGGAALPGQDNKLAGAVMSVSTVAQALALLGKQRSHENIRLNYGKNGLVLVHGPSDAQTAYGIIASQYTSDQLQLNRAASLGIESVQMSSWGSEWLLIAGEPGAKPFILRMHTAPSINVSKAPNGSYVSVTGTLGASFGFRPTESGFIGAA